MGDQLGRRILALLGDGPSATARPDSPSAIDWLFSGTAGIVHITGAVTLTEEFIDRGPSVAVPQRSALHPFFERARGMSALTHRESLDLSLGPDRASTHPAAALNVAADQHQPARVQR